MSKSSCWGFLLGRGRCWHKNRVIMSLWIRSTNLSDSGSDNSSCKADRRAAVAEKQAKVLLCGLWTHRAAEHLKEDCSHGEFLLLIIKYSKLFRQTNVLSRLYMETRSSSSSVLVQWELDLFHQIQTMIFQLYLNFWGCGWDHSKANVVKKKMSVNFAYVAKNTAFLVCLADTPQRSIPAAA